MPTRHDTSRCDTVLDAVGGTPLIRLNRIGAELPCELLVKCEFFNAGGSVKDRVGLQMVLDAERQRRIQPGDTLIEPTSGNTGIGLALACAVKGYKCIIALPEKMSQEKVDILQALGAQIIRTPSDAAFDAPDSHFSVARRLQQEIPNSHILDQYNNPSNPEAHYLGTAEELIQQCQGKIDMVVAGVGTGGTITGLAKRLKEHNPDIQIVGVDPEGSILAVPDSLNDKHRLELYQVEGIGYDFIPNVLDRDLVDAWYKSNDKESLLMMRRLIRDEGILCGGSSGAAVVCALQAAVGLEAGKRVVIILPDSVRNYMSKALSNDWMLDHGFVDGQLVKSKQYSSSMWWAKKRVCDLHRRINTTPLTITSNVSCKDVIRRLKNEGLDILPVTEHGRLVGVVTVENMTKRLLAGQCQPHSTLAEAGVIDGNFHKFNANDSLADLAQALECTPYCLIAEQHPSDPSFTTVHETKTIKGTEAAVDSNPCSEPFRGGAPAITEEGVDDSRLVDLVTDIVTRIDLLEYISNTGNEEDE